MLQCKVVSTRASSRQLEWMVIIADFSESQKDYLGADLESIQSDPPRCHCRLGESANGSWAMPAEALQAAHWRPLWNGSEIPFSIKLGREWLHRGDHGLAT